MEARFSSKGEVSACWQRSTGFAVLQMCASNYRWMIMTDWQCARRHSVRSDLIYGLNRGDNNDRQEDYRLTATHYDSNY